MDLEFFNTPQGIALAIVGTIVLVAVVFNLQQFRAQWKEWALEASNAAAQVGLVHTTKILNALVAGDLKTVFSEVKTLRDVLTNPAQLSAEFSQVAVTLLNGPGGAALKKLISDGTSGASAQQIATDAQAFGATLPQLPALPTFNAALLPHLMANPPLQAAVASAQALGAAVPQLEAMVAGHAAAAGTPPSAAPAPAPKPPASSAPVAAPNAAAPAPAANAA